MWNQKKKGCNVKKITKNKRTSTRGSIGIKLRKNMKKELVKLQNIYAEK